MVTEKAGRLDVSGVPVIFNGTPDRVLMGAGVRTQPNGFYSSLEDLCSANSSLIMA